MGKAATKWTDKLSLWESLLFLGFFYPSQLSRAGRGKLALLLLLPPAPQNLLQQAAKEVRNMHAARGAHQHAGQAAAPQHREAQWHQAALCTAGPSVPPLSPEQLHPLPAPHCPAGGPAPPHQLLCFEVRPQPLHHITSAYFTAGLRHR